MLKSKVTLRMNNKKGTDETKDSYDTDSCLVDMISGDYTSDGPTTRGAMDHVRWLVIVADLDVVESFPEMTIAEYDRGRVYTPHDNPLVIECKVANTTVGQIMIATGSSLISSHGPV